MEPTISCGLCQRLGNNTTWTQNKIMLAFVNSSQNSPTDWPQKVSLRCFYHRFYLSLLEANFTCEMAGLKAEFLSRCWASTLSSFSLVNSRRTRQGFEVNCDSLQDSCNNSASSWSELDFRPVQYSSAKYLTFNSSSSLWICQTSFSKSLTVHHV